MLFITRAYDRVCLESGVSVVLVFYDNDVLSNPSAQQNSKAPEDRGALK